MVNNFKRATVTILESSDVHGAVLPINYSDNSIAEYGMAKLSTIIKKHRAIYSNTILIDNGDILQGTPLTYYYSKMNNQGINPIIKVMNYLKYDAAVIGNHEFNYGSDILEEAIKASSFPWITANITAEDSEAAFYGPPYIVKEYDNGLKVGILGLITQYVPNWENPAYIKGLKFRDPVKWAEKWVKLLRKEEKVDIVIVSYHGGFEKSISDDISIISKTSENQGYEICEKVSGIDVLLTGHQHRNIFNKQINGVLVVQPGSQGRFLAKIKLDLILKAGKWEITSKESELINSADAEPDMEVIELVKRNEENTQKWLDTPIGFINGDMAVTNPLEMRIKDNPLIEFINRVQMDISGVDISCTSLFSDSSPGLSSKVTMRDIVSNYIYPNTLSVLAVTGRDIKEALEKSALYFKTTKGNTFDSLEDIVDGKVQPYNYDMWEGIEYIINISKPLGHRVEKLNYRGLPVQMDKEYKVVLNNYRANGGGEFDMFKNKPVVKDITTDMSEIIANYILERGTINIEVDNNWKVIFC
jgi:2',3'-cyclic-nucleotide 2'-phosphodiesterase/3'-nucleotidase